MCYCMYWYERNDLPFTIIRNNVFNNSKQAVFCTSEHQLAKFKVILSKFLHLNSRSSQGRSEQQTTLARVRENFLVFFE